MAEKKDKKEFTTQEQREAMTEMKTGRRLFDTSKKGLVQVRFPKVEENRLADWEYSKVLMEAVRDKIPTAKQMTQMIEDLGLWTKEDDNKILALQEEINKQIVVMGKLTEGSKNFEKAQETINELRQQILDIQQDKQRLYNNTAESKAEEAKMSYLIYKCSEYADSGKPIWDSYQEFKDEEDQETVNKIVYQFLTFVNGIPADLLQEPSASEIEEVDEEPPTASE